jgi:hypothetical protein
VFPQIPIDEMLTIWCKKQQICGFEIPSLDEVQPLPKGSPEYRPRAGASDALPFGNDSDANAEDSVTDSGADAFSVTDSSANAEENKICQHMYIKGKKVNTQCTTKVKGKCDYCRKYSKA